MGGGVETSGLHKNGGCPRCMVVMQLQILILSEGFPHKGYVCILCLHLHLRWHTCMAQAETLCMLLGRFSSPLSTIGPWILQRQFGLRLRSSKGSPSCFLPSLHTCAARGPRRFQLTWGRNASCICGTMGAAYHCPHFVQNFLG